MYRFTPAVAVSAGLLLVLILLCLPVSAQETDEPSIISLGRHTISKGNISSARGNAITDALDNAVEQAVLSMLSPAEISTSLPLFAQVLTGDTQAHIVTYKVLGETRKGDQYIVAVSSRIDLEALKNLFSQYRETPAEKQLRVLIFMSEQIPGEILPRYWWGNNPIPFESQAQQAFETVLSQNNYASMPRPSKEEIDSWAIPFNFIHDADAAQKLAAHLEADIMIMAKALAEEASNTMGTEQAYKSTISLEAFQVDTGERLTSFTTDAVVKSDFSRTGMEDSLAQSGTLAGKTLVDRLKTILTGRSSGSQTIETRIEGNDYLSSFIMLRKILNTMSGIEDIQTRELSSDNAVVDIIYQGNGKKLADALMLKTFDAFNLNLDDITDHSLTIRFIPKNAEQPVETKDIEGAYISE